MGELSDAHCHATSGLDVEKLVSILKARNFNCCLMSTYWRDWELIQRVRPLRTLLKSQGIHPWFSHLYRVDKTLSKAEHYMTAISGANGDTKSFQILLDLLPEPIDLSLDELATDFEILGLTKFRVDIDHQKKILGIFLELAYRKRVPVSVHCVKAHGALLDQVLKVYARDDSAICLHSYNGPISQTHQWLKKFPNSIYFSFPLFTIVEEEQAQKYRELLKVIPIDRVLIETDRAIDSYDSANAHYQDLKKSAQLLARFTDRSYEEVERILERNFARFVNRCD
ncbi:uncharacterized protein PAS_chr2-1_0738 [Komagataella phaffii GS115]|uniref:Uncharacterized protein n=1 Tax=Komagataella phaffii (strain GS115 / ATCC 20864) TaxID=644223 RepID=C4R1L4_KOMPG|nr:uncharacterized protein PAS_chr2-1_0738 [Komagataella phaffii GS115]CAY69388.1 Protein of unknown function [Komagataella phaffii GS115]